LVLRLIAGDDKTVIDGLGLQNGKRFLDRLPRAIRVDDAVGRLTQDALVELRNTREDERGLAARDGDLLLLRVNDLAEILPVVGILIGGEAFIAKALDQSPVRI